MNQYNARSGRKQSPRCGQSPQSAAGAHLKAARKLRCAIYTRVSSDSGLEQDFNSLDAQREAAEAYIRSQAHEGWQLIRTPYNDGGFSGGRMDRPALQQLLEAVQQRRIDIIVVYKVDRLTRSLADFAKLVELFDAHGVSFVSVTQSFNTTTSMGRLTLNVLLSFAQFEREVTGERIRDKIAASKKKGIWMGGVVPLGYRAEGRALHIVEEHAQIIRAIFDRYLDLCSVIKLRQQLDADKIVMPIRIDGTGKQTGGKPFSRGHLNEILRNPLYIGKLTHKGQVHEGQHDPIIDVELFNRVQSILTVQTQSFHDRKESSDAILRDRLYDDNGNRMSPTWAQKRGKRWRYYVSRAIIEGRKQDAGSMPRVPAEPVEQLIIAALARHGIKPDKLRESVQSIRIHADRIIVTLAADDQDERGQRDPNRRLNNNRSSRECSDPDSSIRSDDSDVLPIDDLPFRENRTIIISWTKTSRLRKREIIPATGEGINANRPMRAEARRKLIDAATTAHVWLHQLTTEWQSIPTQLPIVMVFQNDLLAKHYHSLLLPRISCKLQSKGGCRADLVSRAFSICPWTGKSGKGIWDCL